VSRQSTITSRQFGENARHLAVSLLEERGYRAKILPHNYPTYGVEVEGQVRFYVSVKASRSKQHVRLNVWSSVENLSEGNFVFAFMPRLESFDTDLESGLYGLLIIPTAIALDDAMAATESYVMERARPESEKYHRSLMVKGYSGRAHQKEIW